MITKSANLSRLLLSRSTSYLLNRSSIHIASTKQFNTSSTRQICMTPCLNQKITGSEPSSDLKDILSKKVSSEENQDQENKGQEEEKPGRFAVLFSREHGWKITLAMFGGIFAGCGLYTLFIWGAPKLDENNLEVKDEFTNLPIYSQYPKRAWNAVRNYYTAMKEPSTDKLLPEPLQYPYLQPTYTLVIEMTGLLLHPEWTFNTGWRYKKRPGLDYFLEQIKYPTFEVVLFTREPFLSGHPIVTNLDPQNQIQFRLFRESTNFKDNNYVKDLSFMNRDMSKIIMIDWDESSYKLQPRNALHRIKKWEGEEGDTDLVYLASFLKMIASSGVSDVREVLDYYNGETNPLDTFKMNQVRLHEAELKRQSEIDEMKKATKPAAFSFFKR